MSKKLKHLKLQIKDAEIKVGKARDKMVEKRFDFKYIREYNNKLVVLGDLQTKLKHQEKTTTTRQYMDEVSVPGIILH